MAQLSPDKGGLAAIAPRLYTALLRDYPATAGIYFVSTHLFIWIFHRTPAGIVIKETEPQSLWGS